MKGATEGGEGTMEQIVGMIEKREKLFGGLRKSIERSTPLSAPGKKKTKKRPVGGICG